MRSGSLHHSGGTSNRRRWPYAPAADRPLPASLPGGEPWPKVSVVTPSFNQGAYIEETMLSVLHQDYPNLEYVVIDGGSTDGTMDVVDRYRNRLTYVVSERDNGQSHAINKGMAIASGNLLTWLNSDDMLEPGALAAAALAFHLASPDMVAGVCRLHTDGRIVARHLTSCANGLLPIDDLLDLDGCWLRGQFFYQPEVMFTRTLWDRAGGHVDESLFYSMDYELWLRFAEQGARLHVLGRPMCLYRVHEGQKTFQADSYRPELTTVRDRFLTRHGQAASRSVRRVERTHLRVVFVNDLGSVAGAGIAHQRLAAAMAMAGHDVSAIGIAPDLIESRLPNARILDAVRERTPDLVMLGNIHSARLDPALPALLAERWPTVQVLHDLYSLTGRCAYPGTCVKYLDGCDASCPTAHEYPRLSPDLIHSAWETKNSGLTGTRAPVLAGVSAWSTAVARGRFATGPTPRITSIRYGLPLDIFKPYDKSTCRDLLGLPQDRFLVLFSASALSEVRKGLPRFLAAIEGSDIPDVTAVCIGHLDADVSTERLDVRSLGYVSNPNDLAMLYSAADVFVGPSLVETFGQVFLEAAACGTPSVGYATAGGVAEAIADGVSGRLAADQEAEHLRDAIQRLHDEPDTRRDMGVWSRLWVANEHSYAAAYHRLFAELTRIGLVRELGLPPKIAFVSDSSAPLPVTYLELAPHASAPRVADLGGSSSQLLSRLASVEAERDSLRVGLRTITDTRLWRTLRVFNESYQRVVNSSAVPGVIRRAIGGVGRWLIERPHKDSTAP
jgi:glycosyltransferase involved in cell wall biosynthesis